MASLDDYLRGTDPGSYNKYRQIKEIILGLPLVKWPLDFLYIVEEINRKQYLIKINENNLDFFPKT